MANQPKSEPDTNGNGSANGALSHDFINSLMAGSRKRNTYGPLLVKFVNESDEPGINPREVWPMEVGSKNAATLYTGFMNAAKKCDPPLTDIITVIKREDDVFLIHNERAAVVQAEAAATAS